MDIILSGSESVSPPSAPRGTPGESGPSRPGCSGMESPWMPCWIPLRGTGYRPPFGSTGHRPLQGLPLPSHPLGLRLEIALRFPQPDLSGGGISRVSAEAWRMERLPPVGGVNVKRPTPSSAWGSGSMGVRQPGRSVGVAVAITRRYRNWSRLLRRPDFRHLPRHNGSLCLPPRLAHVITGRWIALG